MKRLILLGFVAAALVGGFAAGFRYGLAKAVPGKPTPSRVPLYYVDPMNPAHTSTVPGVAPCGMKMEPVFADDAAKIPLPHSDSAISDSAINISPARQRLIGVQTAEVLRRPFEHTLHAYGKIAVDEARIYRINAPVDGRITKALGFAPGSFARKHSVLAAYYSPDFLRAGQALLLTLKAKERIKSLQQPAQALANSSPQANELNTPNASYTNQLSVLDYSGQFAQYETTIMQNVEALKNLGMGEPQLEEVIRTREPINDIEVTAPADGFILTRNVSLGQSIEKGTELFRIADLSQVWVVADVFESESENFQPGSKVQVSLPHQSKKVTATISQVLPQYDSASRALKVRLEVENSDFTLKPELLVDVEFPVRLSSTVVIPAESVLDSGAKQTVYVATSDGSFEPREVITGRRLGDRIEIAAGLEPGEQVVTAGNFLLDSESRIRLAARSQLTAAKDAVCGMTVDSNKARAANQFSCYRGHTHYFCSEQCKSTFEKDRDGILERSSLRPKKDPSLALARTSTNQPQP
jgi:membrane fusion protein, copper/silver efflux system